MKPKVQSRLAPPSYSVSHEIVTDVSWRTGTNLKIGLKYIPVADISGTHFALLVMDSVSTTILYSTHHRCFSDVATDVAAAPRYRLPRSDVANAEVGLSWDSTLLAAVSICMLASLGVCSDVPL
ncbi:hypothetical protein BaRGS_00009567 [Batillaria attramentaria]|uniref:Uncharacterized protein n=1 Tax=Batillaria attramentaria TaxID=370345 RepID=A0ABD0LID2_9CAEN